MNDDRKPLNEFTERELCENLAYRTQRIARRGVIAFFTVREIREELRRRADGLPVSGDNEEWTHDLDGDWEPHFDDVCEDNEDAYLCTR